MTATIETTEAVAGWALGTVPADPFAAFDDQYDMDDLFAEPVAEVVEQPAPTVTCKSCGRKLTAAASIARQRGRTCQARFEAAVRAEAADFTARQLEAALDALEEDAVLRVGHLYLAVSSDGSTRYEVAPTGECSCRAATYGHRCWHVLAARIAERSGLPATDPDTVGFAPQEGDDEGDSYSVDPIDL